MSPAREVSALSPHPPPWLPRRMPPSRPRGWPSALCAGATGIVISRSRFGTRPVGHYSSNPVSAKACSRDTPAPTRMPTDRARPAVSAAYSFLKLRGQPRNFQFHGQFRRCYHPDRADCRVNEPSHRFSLTGTVLIARKRRDPGRRIHRPFDRFP